MPYHHSSDRCIRTKSNQSMWHPALGCHMDYTSQHWQEPTAFNSQPLYSEVAVPYLLPRYGVPIVIIIAW